jgi:hypothetical protein
VKEIRLYIEGGGNSDSRKSFRKGMRFFLKELDDLAKRQDIRFDLTFCGSRHSAYEDFVNGLKDHREAFVALLVDSEGPVTMPPWQHLNWDPQGTGNDHCHLMVQMMEAWFIADHNALKSFYGKGFKEKAIPKSKDVEKVAKTEVEKALKTATRATTPGEYHKTKHAPELLSKLNSKAVRESALHCERLFATLTQVMNTDN